MGTMRMDTDEAWRKAVASVPVNSEWRHKKTHGHYVVVAMCRIEANWTSGVIYRSINSDQLIMRPYSEFTDGRFERIGHVKSYV